MVRDPELLDLMQRSGCELVYLGLESVNQATLDGFEKAQTVDDIERAIKLLHEHGIRSHGMFVLGADTDTVQTVRDTVTFAMKNHIDTVMLNILTPLPGTPQFDDLDAEGRIFDKRWELYDAHHVVFEPQLMTPYELQIEMLRGYMRFYSLRTWLRYIFTFRFTKQLLFHSVGHDDHPQLAQGRAQQGLRRGAQADVAAARRPAARRAPGGAEPRATRRDATGRRPGTAPRARRTL